MLASGSDERLAFVGRQLSYMAKQRDFEVDAALAKIDSIGDTSIREAVMSIQQKNELHGLNANAGLFDILRMAKPGADIGALLTEYVAIKKRLEQDVAVYIAGLRGSLIYCGVLLAVAIMLCLIFRFNVAASLEAMYENLGHDLPAYTTFMINEGSLLGLAILGLVAVLTAITGFAVFKLHRDVIRFRYSRIGRAWFLAGNRILTIANTYTLLACMWLLLKAGYADIEVESIARQLAGAPASTGEPSLPEELQWQLEFSKQNHTYADEVAFQLDQAPIEFIEALSKLRSVLNTAYQLLIYILVGSLVIAYYLPIFSLGSLI